MKKQILKMAGVRSESELYKKFIDEASFMKVHGKEFKKAQRGMSIQNKGQLKKLDDLTNFTNYNDIPEAQMGWKSNFKSPQFTQFPGIPNDFGDISQGNPYGQQFGDYISQQRNPNGNDYGQQFGNYVQQQRGSADTGNIGGGGGIASMASKAIPYVQPAMDVVEGISMLKEQKNAVREAHQNAELTGIQAKSAASRDISPIKRNYVRPEDIPFQPNQMFPSYGTGTDILSMKDGGEIQNTYAPNTLYTDLEYEVLQNGGNIGDILNSGQFGDFMNNQGGNEILGNLNNYLGHRGTTPTAGNKIGGGIGQAAGTFFGGPIGGAVGKFAGNLIGGWVDQSDNKIEKYDNISQENYNDILGSYMGQNIQNRNSAFMQEGGNINNEAMNGELQIYENGGVEHISQNPYLPDGGQTVQFTGASHENGGIPISYGNSPVEVEGGEPATKIGDNLVVFGNLKIPNQFLSEIGDENAKGKKFKNYIKDLSKIEKKQTNIVDKSIKELDDLNPITSFDKLKLTSLTAMLDGANMKLKDVADKKERAASLQSAINDTAEELNIDADKLAMGKIKYNKKSKSSQAEFGMSIAQDGKNLKPLDYDYLKGLYTKSQSGQKGDIKKFQSEFVRLVPDIAQQVTNRYAPTNYSKKQGFAPADPFGLIDSMGGKRTNALWDDLELSRMSGKTIGFPQHEFSTIPLTPLNNVLGKNNMGNTSINPEVEKDKFDWMGTASSVFNQALPYLRRSNKMSLDPNQLTGEMYALSNNELEPVQAQTYSPQLSNPYDISYQDAINANQSDFNSIQRQLMDNPEALSTLAGQKYAANEKIYGEQFRQNQAEKARVYEGNRSTLNDAQLKNLSIYDQQYTRQSQAKSNTKAITQAALNSISSKIAQNKLENRTLQTYENLYNYRYDNQGRAINQNPLVDFQAMIDNASPADLAKIEATLKKKTSTKKEARNGSIVKAIKNL